MSVNLEYKAKIYLLFKMDEIKNEAVNYMRSVAPGNAPKPYGNRDVYSTGALAASIRGDRTGMWTIYVAPHVKNKSGKDYAVYADQGRGAISKPYRMKFKTPDGREIRTKYVRGFNGYEFIIKTKHHIIAMYG